jgi:hypothetical protein
MHVHIAALIYFPWWVLLVLLGARPLGSGHHTVCPGSLCIQYLLYSALVLLLTTTDYYSTRVLYSSIYTTLLYPCPVSLCIPVGSGHQYGGAGTTQGGILLDMSAMQAASIHPHTRTARVEPGCTSAQIRELTAPHGLHFPGGHISSVGCAGFILGGSMVA